MKKTQLLFAVLIAVAGFVHAQCVTSCTNYATYTVPFAPLPSAGINAIPLFTPNSDDGYTAPVALGFNFSYYCTNYNSVLVYSNGMIQFNINAPSTFPSGYDRAQTFPDGTAPNALVAFRMDDLDPTVGGSVTYTTLGTTPNQTFVVTYSNVPLYSSASDLYTGQIALYETTNLIDIITIQAPVGNTLATQGIEDATGVFGTGVPGRNNSYWSANATTNRFAAVQATPPSSITGTISSCEGVSNIYTVSAMPGALSYTWALPAGWNGSSSLTTISTTAGASGQVSVSVTYTCGTSGPTTLSVTTIPAPVVAITSATPMILCSGTTVTFNVSGAAVYTLQPGNYIGLPPFFDTPLTSTTYTLTGTNMSGCNSTNLATTMISVKETPTVTVNSGSICMGQTFQMTATGANTYAYSSTFSAVTPSTAGQHTFSVVGTSTNGCTSNTAISTVTVVALPTITAVASKTTVCSKQSSSLTASGASNYTWSAGGTNSTSAVIVVNPVINSNYTVTGATGGGCINTQTVSVFVSPCAGISENNLQLNVNIYPNPAKDKLTIELADAAEMHAYNMLGMEIKHISLSPGKTLVDLSEWPAGNYLITVSTSDGSRNLKLIKE